MKNNNFYAINSLILLVAGIVMMFLDKGTYWTGVCVGAMAISSVNLCSALIWWDENSPVNIKNIKKEDE